MPYEGGDTGGGRRVYVGNIDYAVAEAQLKEEFNQFGPITNIAYKQGFAFIDFDDTRDAQDAISKMSGAETWGRRLQVEFSSKLGDPIWIFRAWHCICLAHRSSMRASAIHSDR